MQLLSTGLYIIAREFVPFSCPHCSYLAKSTSYFGAFPGFSLGNLPPNDTPAGLARGLAEAHAAYGSAK